LFLIHDDALALHPVYRAKGKAATLGETVGDNKLAPRSSPGKPGSYRPIQCKGRFAELA